MKPGLPFVLTMVALVGSGVALAAFNGHAQQSPGNVPAGTEKHVFSSADRAAFPQRGARLPACRFDTVSGAGEALARRRDRAARRGETAVARGQNLEAIADAAAPLYTTLSEDQKHRLPVLMHGLRPHFFQRHFAMMDEGQEFWWRRGGWDKPERFAPEDGDRSGPKER